MIKAGLRPNTAQRRGFTLVELLVVIAIIAVLAAILSVGVSAAVAYIYRFTIGVEVKELEAALTQYQQEYGSVPPCIGTVADTTGAPNSPSAFYSAAFKRHIDTAFRNNREAIGIYAVGSTAILGDSSSASGTLTNATIARLDASETLPYFLGGAALYSDNVLGLKKDPVKPLTGSAAAAPVSLYEFKRDQLVDLDGDGFPSYIPNAADGSTPFVYFSSYAYKDNTSAPAGRIPNLMWPPTDFSSPDPGNYEDWVAGTATAALADGAQGGYDPGVVRPYINGRVAPPNSDWYNENSYQLLSAGLDNLYGSDGVLDGAADPDFPRDIDDPTDPLTYKYLGPTNGGAPWVNMDPEDEDNVANFTEGSTFGEIGLE